jgi:hypothetical protein
MKIQIFYSYACRDSYKVFSWLNCVQEQGAALDILWYPFAVEIENEEDWAQPWQTARSELRGFIAAESAQLQGEYAFRRFHQLLECAVHEEYLELGDEQTILSAAKQAALDMDSFQAALNNPEMTAIARQSHRRGVEQFKVFGTPTLIFPQESAIHLELNEIPMPDHAVQLFESVKALAWIIPMCIKSKERYNTSVSSRSHSQYEHLYIRSH